MNNSINKYEGRWRKKLLRTQVYNISNKLAKALTIYDKKNKWIENEIINPIKEKRNNNW